MDELMLTVWKGGMEGWREGGARARGRAQLEVRGKDEFLKIKGAKSREAQTLALHPPQRLCLLFFWSVHCHPKVSGSDGFK